jgi:hypothetical protein
MKRPTHIAANEDVRGGRRSYMTMQEKRRISTRWSSTCPVLALGHQPPAIHQAHGVRNGSGYGGARD